MRIADVYQENLGFVWACARRLGVPESELEDAAHDVFVTAHRRRHEVADVADIRCWLFATIRRVAANYRRGMDRHRRRLGAAEDVAVVRRQLARVGEHDDAVELVTAFVLGLPESQRDVFILFELQQLTAREVGEVLGINPNTASARLRAARQAFERFAMRVQAERAFDAGEAITRVRSSPPPTAEQRVRVGAAIAASVSRAATVPVLAWVKAASLGVAATAATIAVAAIAEPSDDRPRVAAITAIATDARGADERAPTPAIAPSLHAATPADIVDPSRARAKLAATPRQPQATSPSSSAPGLDLAVHNEALAQARAALGRGEHDQASRIAGDYRRRFADGPFVAELTLLDVRARCAAGDGAGARAVASALLVDHADSPHAELVARTCAGSITKSTAAGNSDR